MQAFGAARLRLGLVALLVGLAGAATLSPIARAHHGWGSYDSTQLLTLTGSIEAVAFENPHGTLRLTTPEKNWLVILSPPQRMINRGLAADMLKPGGTVTVEGYPHKTDAMELRAERITVGDRTFELR